MRFITLPSLVLLLATWTATALANTTITALPLGSAAASSTNSVLPYVDTSDNTTKKLKLSDLINVPALADPPFCTGKVLTGFSSTTGVITAADTILTAIDKLNGNVNALSGASVTVGTYDSQAPAANGATAITNVLYNQSADATHPGMMSIGSQSIAGAKTFTGAISASNLSGTNTGDQTITLTSDVTGSGTGSFATTIANSAVTNAKMANMTQGTFKGRAAAAGTGAPTDLTGTQATAMLDTFTSGAQGLVPASGGSSTSLFLTQAGTFASAGTTSPLTTKGDIYGYSTTNDRLPVGANNTFLMADSSQTLGLAYTASTGSGSVVRATSPTMSDPVVGTQASTDNSTKAASTAYVTTAMNQLNPAAAVYAASTASITGTYTNAVGGVCVGDTFTITATGALSMDGQSPASGARVLLKDQSSTFQNGVWTVTTVGSVGVSPVLTRATDFNTAASMNSGQIIPVATGTVNAGSSWYQTATIATCSSDAQTWTQFQAASSAYFLLAGRSGGQTGIGGTASGNNLTLKSTSNGTVGSVIISPQALEKTQIGPTGSTTVWPNKTEIMVPNTNSVSNGVVIHSNELNYPSTQNNQASPQAFAVFPHDGGGEFLMAATTAGAGLFRVYRSTDGLSLGYMGLGAPWGFMNANAGIVSAKVSGTTGQSVDLMEFSKTSDFGSVDSSIGSGGQFRAPLGVVGTPGFAFQGDTNNGWWSPSADVQAWSTSGVERMRLSSVGLTMGLTGTTTGLLNISGATSGLFTQTSPTAAGTWTFTWPATAGTNHNTIHTDGSGIASWSMIDLTTDVTGLLPAANVNGGRTINAQTGTTYTFVLGDASNAGGSPLVTSSNGSAQTITVPPQSSVVWLAGAQIDVCQIGAGKMTIAQGSGVTISSKGSNKSAGGQNVCLSLVRTGSDAWLLIGDLIP